MAIKNIVGVRFGRLVVVSFAGFREHAHSTRRSLWNCVCDCGNTHITTAKMLRGGSPISCGCLQREAVSKAARTHGMSRTKIYKIWTSMKLRCGDKNSNGWDLYGGRGITVCDRWASSFELFLSDMGMPSAGQSIDRIDNNGPYSPENCKWATKSEQGDNTRRTRLFSMNGKTQSLRRWCEELDVNYSTASARINKYHLPIEDAVRKGRFSRGDLQYRQHSQHSK